MPLEEAKQKQKIQRDDFESIRRHIKQRKLWFMYAHLECFFIWMDFSKTLRTAWWKKQITHTRFESSEFCFSDSRSCSSVSSALAADKSPKNIVQESRENKSHAHFHWKWIFISSSSPPHPPPPHSYSCCSCSCSSWFFGARVFNCRALRVGSSIKNAN